MNKARQKCLRRHPCLKNVAVPCVLLLSMLLSACAPDPESDLAVAKLPKSQVQATNYLPLNPDIPGTPVHVQRYLVPGKYNIVGYFSPFDGASVILGPRLMQLTQSRQDLAVRTVNVNRPGVQTIDWQSPILQGSPIQRLPHFEIYDPGLNLRAQGRPAYEQIRQWLQAMPVQP